MSKCTELVKGQLACIAAASTAILVSAVSEGFSRVEVGWFALLAVAAIGVPAAALLLADAWRD